MLERLLLREPQFKFVYVVHDGLDRANDTWEMVKNCDIILQEEIWHSEGERNDREKLIALATHKSFLPSKNPLRRHFLSKRQNDWADSLVANAIEAGREFHYIDVLTSSPEIKMLRDAEILHKQSLALLHKGEPLVSIRVLEKSVKKYALSNRMRTKAVLTQIVKLREKGGKSWNGKRIGIVQGVVHEPAFEIFKKTFPGYDAEKEVMDAVSPALVAAITEKELFPDKKVDPKYLIKTLLSDGIVYNYLKLLNDDADDSIICGLADKIGVALTPEEVDQYWQMIIATDGKQDECQDRMWEVATIIGKKWKSKETGLDS